jgi:hypothetical protein
MKLTIVLMVVLGYSALLLTNAAPQKSGKKPPAKPTPTPVVKKTPATTTATPTPTVQPTPKASPTITPTATPASSPTATPVPSPSSTAAGPKEPCESKVQASGIPLCSRVQPKEVVLSKDSKDPKGKPVLLTHEAHATKNYSEDGRSVIGCTVCHHTDQPKMMLSGVLKTSERDVVLTATTLAAKPVASCRACHERTGQTPARWPAIPTVKYPEDDDPVAITNDEAYHRNCNTCHEAVKKRNPTTKAPTTCAACHNGGTR